MWNNCIENAQAQICLHDCTADGIRQVGDMLIFSFSDGFWLKDRAAQTAVPELHFAALKRR